MVALLRTCLVVAIALAPSTITAQGKGGRSLPKDPHGPAASGRGAATPPPRSAGGGDRRVRSQKPQRGERILPIPLLIDANEVNPEQEEAAPRRLTPPSPPVESSSIQPPFQPAATASVAQGSLRGNLWLDVEPNHAQVYVDGFFHGTVVDCQRSPAGLSLASGWHRLELRAPGFETPAINVTVVTNQTTRYVGALKPSRP